MRITSRTRTIAFFITLGAVLTAVAIFLNVSWIIYHSRSIVPLILGIVFFAAIIAGLVVYTIFIVREISRNERQDSFLNAVTHELKTPIASIRLYLETLQTRPIDEAQRSEFYRIMLEDSERLLRHRRTSPESRRSAPPHSQAQLAGRSTSAPSSPIPSSSPASVITSRPECLRFGSDTRETI